MTKHSFMVFFRIFGGIAQKQRVEAYSPELAVRDLREYYAGKAIHVIKIKRIPETVGEANEGHADNNQSNVASDDNSRGYRKSM
jgi:hypothetical protein